MAITSDEYIYTPKEIGWWDASPKTDLVPEEVEKARANSLINCARQLETAQQEVHKQNLWNAQLYSNRELASFDWGNGSLYRASLAPINRTGENVVLSTVDTLVSQVGKQRPKAKPQTHGGSWKLRKQARLLDKFLYGEFIRNRVYDHGKQVFRDACIFGFGCLYVCMEGEGDKQKIKVERVFPDEILIDQMEVVACGKPRHIYRRRVLPVEVVSSTWDIPIADLRSIASAGDYLEYRAVGKGWVAVVEGWQLALPDQPGRYFCAVQGMVLDECEWKDEHPPFVWYHWQVPVAGFYSPSAVEQALPYQIRLNEINEVIRDAQDIMGRPRLLVAEGSRINPLEIDNLVARIIKYVGVKPEAVTWPAISAELYNERDRCIRMCRDQFGLNDASTSATLGPSARYDSSAAVREVNAIQDDRLSDPAQRLERFYLDLAETMIRVISNHSAKPKTTWISGGKHSRIEVVDWSEIDLDRDSYVLTLEATSIASSGPAAQRDDLEKQFAMGIITPEQYRLELSHPDDQAELSLQAAAAADLRRVVELLEDGKYENPSPIQDLVNGVVLVSLAALNLNQYDEDENPELVDIKLNFVDWVTAARGWLDDGAEQHEGAGDVIPASMGPGLLPPQGGPIGPSAMPVPEAAGLATGARPPHIQ